MAHRANDLRAVTAGSSHLFSHHTAFVILFNISYKKTKINNGTAPTFRQQPLRIKSSPSPCRAGQGRLSSDRLVDTGGSHAKDHGSMSSYCLWTIICKLYSGNRPVLMLFNLISAGFMISL